MVLTLRDHDAAIDWSPWKHHQSNPAFVLPLHEKFPVQNRYGSVETKADKNERFDNFV